MKLTKVKIGDTEYKIKYVEKIKHIVHEIDNKIRLKTEILGMCYPRNGFWEPGKIVVKISDDPDNTADTVFHEITHAMLNEMMNECHNHKTCKNINELNNDEFFVQKFSELLRDVVTSMRIKRDNKWGGKRKSMN